MIGSIYTTTDYKRYFIPYECEFCQLDTGKKGLIKNAKKIN